MANLQAHEAGEAGGARSGAGPSAQILIGHLRPAQSQNGPAQVNGQRKHYHRHGQGNPSPHRLSLKATINLRLFYHLPKQHKKPTAKKN